MDKRLWAAILCIFLIGCTTTNSSTLNSHLQLRVGELERQLDVKEDQIANLQQEVKSLSYEIDLLKTKVHKEPEVPAYTRKKVSSKVLKKETGIIRINATTEQVQQALFNAGYYEGAVDGKIGAKTKKAIEDFQRSRGLKIDGIVGRQTWEVLQEYIP